MKTNAIIVHKLGGPEEMIWEELLKLELLT